MLTLTLSPGDGRIAVAANGKPSHGFPLADLALTPEQAEEFFADPSHYGGRLFAALFPERSFARQMLDALPPAPHPDGVLLLAVPAPAPGVPDLHSVPWEVLHDSSGFLAARYGMARVLTPSPGPSGHPLPLSRFAGEGEGAQGVGVRLLFVPADPLLWPNGEPAPYALSVEEEWEEVLAVLREADPPVDLVKVVPPTADALGEALAGARGSIFHFTGHGNWDGRTARLLFETPAGASDPVEAGRVADLLRGRVSLAVLSACLSATPGESPEANLAALLCAQGTPFVLGMQWTVPDVSARRFVVRFYRYLFRGETVLEAVRQGRLAVLNDPSLPSQDRRLAFGTPVLYVRGPALPEFRLPEGKGLVVRAPAPAMDLSALPVPEVGFFGRHRELVDVGEVLVGGRGAGRGAVLTLHGTGGIGKTALLRRAAERFAWAFDRVLALPLEPLPTRASVLGRLEEFLGLRPDPAWNLERRQEAVAGALAQARVLLALDNYETLTRAGDEGDADARALHRFLRGLPARGVAFLVSSRERTDLPGERRVDVSGLDERAGAALFRQWVSARRDALTERGMRALARRVGGHPLALKLLARRFDEGTDSLADFLARLEEVLPEAAERWDEGRRHDTLRACFDFSLAPLAERDPALAEGLARLTLFSGPFIDRMAAPVLFGAERALEAPEQAREALVRRAAETLHRLWDRGLLERTALPLGLQVEETLYLYTVHPALAPFARARLGPEARVQAEEGFFRAMRALAEKCYPASEGGGIYANPLLAFLARLALSDLRRAARMREDREGSLLRFHTGWLLRVFGDLEGAMGLYREVLTIVESLGDLQGKSATLHEMAYILRVRGNLDGAMELYRESLAIDESLGDLQGKGATLHEMAYILRVRGNLEGAMGLYRESLAVWESLGDLQGKGATLHAMAGILAVRGDLEEAMGLYREVLTIVESLGDLQGKGATLHEMAGILAVRGDLEGAMGLYRESLAVWESLGALRGKASTLHEMAGILAVRGTWTGQWSCIGSRWRSRNPWVTCWAKRPRCTRWPISWRCGGPGGAMGLYRESQAVWESLGDLQGKAATLHEMAGILAVRGDLEGAMGLYRESLAIKESLGDLRGKAATLHEMAYILRVRGDLDGAMELYRESLAIKESLGDLLGKAATLAMMGQVLVVQGKLDKAMQRYQDALAILESLGDLRGKAATLHEMAGILAVRGDLDGAMELYRESLAIKESLGDLLGKAATLHEMAGILAVRGDLDGAMELYRESLAIKESLGDLLGKAATLHAMAYILAVRGDLEGAMGLYRESQAVWESLGDLQGKAATLHEMAGILAVRGDLEGAMGLYRESLAIKESLGDLRGKGATLHEMAYILAVRGDLDGAMELYRESLAIKESLGDLRGKAATLAMMGQVLVVQGKLDKAMQRYQDALAILGSLGDLRGKGATLTMMGQVLLARGEVREGVRALRQALEILVGMGTRADAEQVAGIVAEVRRMLGEMFDVLWAEAGGD